MLEIDSDYEIESSDRRIRVLPESAERLNSTHLENLTETVEKGHPVDSGTEILATQNGQSRLLAPEFVTLEEALAEIARLRREVEIYRYDFQVRRGARDVTDTRVRDRLRFWRRSA